MIVSLTDCDNFNSIQKAIDSIPCDNNQWVKIYIKNGIYKEKLFINKPFVHLIGESNYKTIITYDDSAFKKLPNGEKMGTFNSYSCFIGADNFIAENITFENPAGVGRVVGQAVAAYVDGDRMKFNNCRFIGSQDTLFTGPLPPTPIEPNGFKGPRENSPRINGRHYYENCYIEGDIDFIFGSATAVFKNCEIFSHDINSPINGYITAASTPENQDYGYVFIDCKLTSNAPSETVYLGRPWRNFAHVAFINCSMGNHIHPYGWHNWNKKDAEKTVKFVEYNSTGLGGNTTTRVSWSRILNEHELEFYSISKVLSGSDGWNPEI